MSEKKNELGVSEEDLENIETVLSDLMDVIVKFKGFEEVTEADYTHLMSTLDFAKFVVSGIIYSNGMDLCSDHDHSESDDDDDEGVE